MITLSYGKKLIDSGFSIFAIDKDKKPIYSWKAYQTKLISKSEFENQFNHKQKHYIGYACGFGGIEVIDVDLKVFPTLKEQNDFWNEFLDLLRTNIDDFDLKFVIYKTVNQGYHIAYRCDEPGRNVKIAVLKNHKEAVIESRGQGGYCILYTNQISKLSYSEIKNISNRDKDILWSICKTYHYTGDQELKEPKNESDDISPWQDYNDKTSIWDIIFDDFKIVRKTSDKDIIKREGGTSPHSGYVYHNSGMMFLFSTGTIYPHEQLISPFIAYSYKYHNGDFSKAASELYQKGFGSRRKKDVKLPLPKEYETIIKRQQFPVNIFPESIQSFILQSAETLGLSVDYMGCAFLWCLSLSIGNTMIVEVKPGWKEVATLWIALVGKAGIGKTPSLNQMIFPLRNLNIKRQKEYQRDYAKWIEYEKLDKEQKKFSEEQIKPKSQQFIVGDITLEALVDLHESNPCALGVFKDELAGWFKDMNKYRAGSDLEFWLSSWNGQAISLNRKSSKSAFVDKPFIPVIGGIQPDIFERFATGENKENGFVDRMLISYPELNVERYNNNVLNEDLISWYEAYLMDFKNVMFKGFFNTDERGEIIPMVVTMSEECRAEWIRIHDKISDMQNSDDENEYMKSMLPKQKSYIPRFALLLNALMSYDQGTNAAKVSKDSMLKAERLSDYFVNMSKLVKKDAQQKYDLREISKSKSTKFDKFKVMYQADPEMNRTMASEILQVSRKTINNWINKLDKNEK
jgi:hypothetical protein